jgi:hypothetical protein
MRKIRIMRPRGVCNNKNLESNAVASFVSEPRKSLWTARVRDLDGVPEFVEVPGECRSDVPITSHLLPHHPTLQIGAK